MLQEPISFFKKEQFVLLYYRQEILEIKNNSNINTIFPDLYLQYAHAVSYTIQLKHKTLT